MEQMILLLTQTAKIVGISPQLLIAICMTETNLRNIDTPNDGITTSYGVCQVKLETAQFMGKVYKKPHLVAFTSEDMRDLKKNIKVAALYVKYQIERYDGDLCRAVAAYNAGRFKESTKYPGKPFNWKYVEKVQSKVNDDPVLESSLECGNPKEMVAMN
jgi:hypothetical protein